MAVTCTDDGAGYELKQCDLGCADAPQPHCKYLQPKYLPDVCDTVATNDLVIASSGTIDPNVDTTCSGGVFPQGGADLCVVRAKTITVQSTASLTIAGSAGVTGRSIAFVADGELMVSGKLDAGAHMGVNGPGGGTYVSGGAATINSSQNVAGAGGGAGGATAGGAGATNGSAAADGGAMNGGAQVMNPALLASFVGGASSFRYDHGGQIPLDTNYGGGGGAVMLVSCRGTVTVDGMVNAGGGGGAGGVIPTGFPLPGLPWAGGAGGYIVVQGRNVSVSGQFFANGGGGGQGWQPTQGQAGLVGADGSTSDTSPGLGGNALGGAGLGGNGGWIGFHAEEGHRATATGGGPGAGGGSVGFLQTYTPQGVTPILTPSHVSPAFQPNGTVELR